MAHFDPSSLGMWSRGCRLSRRNCPPVIVQQGCCPVTGVPIHSRPAGVFPRPVVGGPRRPVEYSRPPQVTPGAPPQIQSQPKTTPPQAAVPPSPAGVIGEAYTSPPAPKSTLPLGAVPLPTGAPLDLTAPTTVAQGNRFFPGGWQNAMTADQLPGYAPKLDLAAIQNRGRKQARPGAQGGFMPTAAPLNMAGMAGVPMHHRQPGSLEILRASGLFQVANQAQAFAAQSGGRTPAEIEALNSQAQLSRGGGTYAIEQQLRPFLQARGVQLAPLALVGERF